MRMDRINKKILLAGFVVIFLFCIFLASGHQPRIVYMENISYYPQIILNPEVSQAFYAELKGQPEYYITYLNQSFNLYANILEPVIKNKNPKKDFIVRIMIINSSIKNFSTVAILNGTDFTWTKFYEEFAGDDYWRGPEFKKTAEPIEYIFEVSNKDNRGKYVFVIGKEEAFPLNEAINTLLNMPKLKIYFDKSILLSFYNRIGTFLLIALIFLVLIIFAILFLIKKILRLVKNKKPKKQE